MPIMMSDTLMTAHSSSPFEVQLRHRFIDNGGRNEDAVVDVNANVRGRGADIDDIALELIDTIGVRRRIQRSAHALTDRAIPMFFVSVDIDGGGLVKIEFSGMRPSRRRAR
jgi:hypothetical protein